MSDRDTPNAITEDEAAVLQDALIPRRRGGELTEAEAEALRRTIEGEKS